MCGIVGFHKIGSKTDSLAIEDVVGAFIECSTRGTQATGFFSPATGVIKTPEKADKFCETHRVDIQKAIDSGIMMGHCRAASMGFKGNYASPDKNENNHPHEGKRYVLVHNGIYSWAPPIKGYEYKGECDSELALSYIETFGIKRAIEFMERADSYSLVIFDKQEGLLYAYRNNNPLIAGITKSGLFLYGSTSQIIVNMCADKTVYGFKVCDSVPFFSTKENFLHVIAPGKGLIENVRIEPCTSVYAMGKEKDGGVLDFEKWTELKTQKNTPPVVNRREREFNNPTIRHSEGYYPAWIDEVFLAIAGGIVRFSPPLTKTGQTTLFN